jgi:IQ calmodulin-binding motif
MLVVPAPYTPIKNVRYTNQSPRSVVAHGGLYSNGEEQFSNPNPNPPASPRGFRTGQSLVTSGSTGSTEGPKRGIPLAPISPRKSQWGAQQGVTESPLTQTNTHNNGSLTSLLEAVPAVSGPSTDDDETSQVSFRTAAKRFGQSCSPKSPIKQAATTRRAFGSVSNATLPLVSFDEVSEKDSQPVAAPSVENQPHCPQTPSHTKATYTSPTKQTMSVGRATMNQKAIPTIPHMVPMSPLVDTKAAATLPHANGNKFAFSKVFQTRYNTAATTIQKRVRMLCAQRTFAQLQLLAHQEAEQRRIQQELLRQKRQAAIKIQSVARSWSVRLNMQVYKLEHQLKVIERSKAQDLAAIARWKVDKKKAIQEKYKAQLAKQKENDRMFQETLDKASQVIGYLRKINARQRVKNDTLRAAIDQLLAENQMLNEESTRYTNFREITDSMSKASTNKTVLLSVLEEFEQKKLAMQSAIERRDDRIMFENRVGRLYFNAIRGVTVLLETSCTDEDLVYSIESMCLELERKGHGLDASEYENSARDLQMM